MGRSSQTTRCLISTHLKEKKTSRTLTSNFFIIVVVCISSLCLLYFFTSTTFFTARIDDLSEWEALGLVFYTTRLLGSFFFLATLVSTKFFLFRTVISHTNSSICHDEDTRWKRRLFGFFVSLFHSGSNKFCTQPRCKKQTKNV